MASGAFWAYGSALQLGDGAVSEAFTSIAEITKLVPPGMKRDSIEVTNQQSTEGWKEFIPGWRDGGEVEIEANWLPTNATHNASTGLVETFADNVNHNFRIVLPDNILTISFAGHLSGVEPDLPLEDKGILSCKIKVSGKVTFSV